MRRVLDSASALATVGDVLYQIASSCTQDGLAGGKGPVGNHNAVVFRAPAVQPLPGSELPDPTSTDTAAYPTPSDSDSDSDSDD